MKSVLGIFSAIFLLLCVNTVWAKDARHNIPSMAPMYGIHMEKRNLDVMQQVVSRAIQVNKNSKNADVKSASARLIAKVNIDIKKQKEIIQVLESIIHRNRLKSYKENLALALEIKEKAKDSNVKKAAGTIEARMKAAMRREGRIISGMTQQGRKNLASGKRREGKPL